MEVDVKAAYMPSKDVVARDIENELIIVPLTTGVGDLEGTLYTLNDIGREIWLRFDGSRTLGEIIEELQNEYDASEAEIETDVMGLTSELLSRGIIQAQISSL